MLPKATKNGTIVKKTGNTEGNVKCLSNALIRKSMRNKQSAMQNTRPHQKNAKTKTRKEMV